MKCKNLTFEAIELTDGFWKERQDLIRSTTVWNVYRRFAETGRFEAFKLNWKEGEPNRPHIFWDSDVAKWIEGVAYLTAKQREPELEAIVDEVADDIERGQMPDGYFNSYYCRIEPEKRFSVRNNHELYCAGHLIEAAIAYDRATGKSKLLNLMKRYAALIRKIFMEERSAAFDGPGHEEIELALVKLYDYTQDRQYLELAAFFIEQRGKDHRESQGWARPDHAYEQSHLPVREQTEAIGHAVRAVYLYSAMADLAERLNDETLKNTCKRLFQDITERKMYITGSIGSAYNYTSVINGVKSGMGEAFEESYRLPNETAYAETCAALGLALFARRLSCIEPENAVYADIAERILYNGFLSGMSLDGKSFFYENAQEIDLEERRRKDAFRRQEHMPITQRVEVFSCSCCPPNITRLIPSVGDFLYHYTADRVYVDQYMASVADFGDCRIIQETAYPYSDTVALIYHGTPRQLALRIPSWCSNYSLFKNKEPIQATLQNRYLIVTAEENDKFLLSLPMQVRHIKADPRVRANRGKLALTYGPFVMCAEGIDNGEKLYEIKLILGEEKIGFDEHLKLPTVICRGVRETATALYSEELQSTPQPVKLIPYFAFANRGESDMRIWFDAEQA